MKVNLALVSLCAVLMASACTGETPAAKDAIANKETPAAESTPAAENTSAAQTQTASEPSTPCDDALDQRSMTACWSKESRAEEEQVDAALKKLDELFASKEITAARQQLQDDQRRWREFVEGHCGLYGELLDGGSAAPMTVAVCRWQLAQTRMQQLTVLTQEIDR